MIKLSIIIPFYNVEQYIAQCLDSVYQQDIPETEYEVICVNDASPDSSREIVKEYQKKHKNLVLVEHEKNKKLGAARNTGRRAAKGTYIWNVDSDDMIAPNCLKEMLDLCEQEELDVLLFNSSVIRDGAISARNMSLWDESKPVTTGMLFWKDQGIKNQQHISPVWTQMYRRAYLDQQLIFSPEINMSEDVPYTYATILFASRIKAINTPYYIYRENNASLLGTMRKVPKSEAIYENSFISGAYMYDLMKRLKNADISIYQSVEKVTQYIVSLYHHYAQSLNKESLRKLRMLCLKNAYKNRFVYAVLSRKQCLIYTRFILTGKL